MSKRKSRLGIYTAVAATVLWLGYVTSDALKHSRFTKEQRTHLLQIERAVTVHDSLPAHGNVERVSLRLDSLHLRIATIEDLMDSLWHRQDFP